MKVSNFSERPYSGGKLLTDLTNLRAAMIAVTESIVDQLEMVKSE